VRPPGKSAAVDNSPLASHSRPQFGTYHQQHPPRTSGYSQHSHPGFDRFAATIEQADLLFTRPGVMNVMSGHPPRKKIRLKQCIMIDSENSIAVHNSRRSPRRRAPSSRSKQSSPAWWAPTVTPGGAAEVPDAGHRSPVSRPPKGTRKNPAEDRQEAHIGQGYHQAYPGPGTITARFLHLTSVLELGRGEMYHQRNKPPVKNEARGFFAVIPPFNRTRKNSKKAHFRYPISETNPKKWGVFWGNGSFPMRFS
jgi:hypothetical protein